MVCTEQLIHCCIFDMNSNFLYWFNVIYGLNHLDRRKEIVEGHLASSAIPTRALVSNWGFQQCLKNYG